MGRIMKWFFIVLILVVASGALLVLSRAPRLDRNWETAFSRAPYFTLNQSDSFELVDLRAFEFRNNGVAEEKWRTETLRPEEIDEIWFFVEPFEGWDAAAHGFLSFVFDGEERKAISVSVEARKEQGETYSGFRGLFNAYELLYVWSTEKDVLTRIAVSLDHELFAYRLKVTPEQAQAIFAHFVSRTNGLHETPRFYNTLTSNCTNELAKAVNDAFPGALPWHRSHVFTGRAAERLHALGFLAPATAPFEDIKSKAEIRDLVKAASALPPEEFSVSWREQYDRRRIVGEARTAPEPGKKD